MMFGNAAVSFDMLDAQTKLMHLRKLHKVVEKALLEFPFQETEMFVSLVSSEPWNNPVNDETRRARLSSNSIEASVMARFQRQSALCTAYAVFEFALLELAKNFRVAVGLAPNPPKNRDRGLKRVVSLLSDAGHTPEIFTGLQWAECLDIAKIRNKVMHSGGLIQIADRAEFSQIRGVYFEDFEAGERLLQLCVDYHYVPRVFRIFEDFLDGANGEIERTFLQC